MVTNGYGFACEEMIRELLPEVGIPHKNTRGTMRDWFWWASNFEDHVLGIDCWVTINCCEFAVDFTVISNEEQMRVKSSKAFNRGVIPIFLAQGMICRANNGDERALEMMNTEIRAQIGLKCGLLTRRMTRELAAQQKLTMGHSTKVLPDQRAIFGGAELVGATR